MGHIPRLFLSSPVDVFGIALLGSRPGTPSAALSSLAISSSLLLLRVTFGRHYRMTSTVL